MTDKLEIFYNDLTEAGQKKVRDFDDSVPGVILESIEPMFSARKQTDSAALGTALHGAIEKALAAIHKKTGKTVPSSIITDIMAQIKNGDDVAGLILDKETGEFATLTKAEANIAANSLDCDTVMVDDGSCNCPECQAKRAGDKAPEKWN